MGLIEQAAKRLEELRQAGVAVPWSAAGVTEEEVRRLAQREAKAEASSGAAAHRRTPERRTPSISLAGGTALGAPVPAASGEAPVQPARDAAVAVAPAAAAGDPFRGAPQPAPQLRRSAEVTIDLQRLKSEGCLVPELARSPLADEFRNLKRPLLKNAASRIQTGEPARSLVMVTSALPGEGKTFCSINLAMSIAMEVDSSVLLVDADVVRPALFGRLGLESGSRKGLLDVLKDPSMDLSEVLLKTNVPKLSLLPSGTLDAKSTELLASVAMEQLLGELAQRYPDRIIIFDAPPLLPTTEARVLAASMGQVVMVVSAATTAVRDVKQAFTAIEKCPLVLSVLNKCRDPFEKSAYGYYYG